MSNLLSEMFPYAFVLKFIVVLYSEKLIAEFNEERILYKEDLKPNNSWNGGVIYTNKAKRYSKGKK